MARDDDLMRRMYGGRAGQPTEPAPPDERSSDGKGILPLFWVLGLALAVAAATAVSVATLFLAATSGPGPLIAHGVVDPADFVVAVLHEDLSTGCVITQDRVVRFVDWRAVNELGLRGVTATTGPNSVEVNSGGRGFQCPFPPDVDPRPFVDAFPTQAD